MLSTRRTEKIEGEAEEEAVFMKPEQVEEDSKILESNRARPEMGQGAKCKTLVARPWRSTM